MEFITSERSKTLLVFEGFKFSFQKLLKGDVERWICCTKSCKCSVKLINNRTDLLEKLNDHNHERIEKKLLNRQKLSNSLKRKATADISTRPRKLICSELRNSDVDTLDASDLNLIRHNMHRARLARHPTLPKSIEETQNAIKNMDIQTNTGEFFLFVNDEETKIIMFSTVSNLQLLCDSQRVFMDGTFKSCPKFYFQVFTLLGLKNNVYIPLVFLLLPGKTKSIYKQAFQHVNKFVQIPYKFLPKV
uniref:FLYWCH-type domain-containing protein n=1 Tax=Cacopsylla melanoneura TaxID=428564 RepID=A0A8D8RSN6_9HEMI